ncbi:unannotated protein [freshwater metagenome]|uniref:Unannotated protein n=1 Tax=freshwater metagenome TaxID=449393 RepID=A0A6J6F107_9ZZZZ
MRPVPFGYRLWESPLPLSRLAETELWFCRPCDTPAIPPAGGVCVLRQNDGTELAHVIVEKLQRARPRNR